MQQYLYLLGRINYLLCILGTYYKALTAKNAFVAYDMSLIARKANSLDRTVTDTFIAVFTVGFFKSKTIAHCLFPFKL